MATSTIQKIHLYGPTRTSLSVDAPLGMAVYDVVRHVRKHDQGVEKQETDCQLSKKADELELPLTRHLTESGCQEGQQSAARG